MYVWLQVKVTPELSGLLQSKLIEINKAHVKGARQAVRDAEDAEKREPIIQAMNERGKRISITNLVRSLLSLGVEQISTEDILGGISEGVAKGRPRGR